MLLRFKFRMLGRKRGRLIAKNAKSARSADPFEEFKKSSRKEMGRYAIPGEIWKSIKKLLWLAAGSAVFYFVRECWLSWNIFQ